ncbi:MAG: bifunctional phosphopantothenoylcysteine decarboxylase/phosphopantothenate--cysteine ligase CoaBC [Bdellovibrionales bacterium]|nr:bifunctional phosphopantothenoylcysteine decarboxylase/phosphopantothenate--cysteine ligase CoaBC [Bdellovibrionales bacterium]
MKKWTPKKPSPSNLGDHDVPLLGDHLKGHKIALLVTGGIAAMTTPQLARQLRRYGAEVIAYLSEEAKKYVTCEALEWSTNHPVIDKLTPRSEHLSGDFAIDTYLVAPATYNTINKIRQGIADTLITTTMASALGKMEEGNAKILIVPTMHGSMHNSILDESLNYLIQLGVHVIAPRDENGKHNMPLVENLVAEVLAWTSHSKLKNKKILITGGPTPVKVDSVRRLTNKFTGQLSLLLAQELYFRGAEVSFILGNSGLPTPDYLNVFSVEDYDEYKSTVLNQLDQQRFDCGIFSAAVADYKPKNIASGKIPSGGALQNIELTSIEKVIDIVKEQFPDLKMISFKYEEGISHNELIQIAQGRLNRGHFAVVANRGEDFKVSNDQVAYIVSQDQVTQAIVSKHKIAQELADFLESNL